MEALTYCPATVLMDSLNIERLIAHAIIKQPKVSRVILIMKSR